MAKHLPNLRYLRRVMTGETAAKGAASAIHKFGNLKKALAYFKM
jgi:hypothetical protein